MSTKIFDGYLLPQRGLIVLHRTLEARCAEEEAAGRKPTAPHEFVHLILEVERWMRSEEGRAARRAEEEVIRPKLKPVIEKRDLVGEEKTA